MGWDEGPHFVKGRNGKRGEHIRLDILGGVQGGLDIREDLSVFRRAGRITLCNLLCFLS
jgi:hypothetical protein